MSEYSYMVLVTSKLRRLEFIYYYGQLLGRSLSVTLTCSMNQLNTPYDPALN